MKVDEVVKEILELNRGSDDYFLLAGYLIDYRHYGERMEVPSAINMIYSVACMQIDKAKELSAKRSECGKLRNANIDNQQDNEDLLKQSRSKAEAKQKQNNNSAINFKALADYWNEKMKGKSIPSIRTIEDSRRKAVNARSAKYGKESIMIAINNAADSDFLNGNNKDNFIASFDWVFAPKNFPKVLEGNYKNKAYGKKESGRVAEVSDKFTPLWGEVSD